MFRLPSPKPKRPYVVELILLVVAVACNLPYEYQVVDGLPALHRPPYEVMQDEALAPRITIGGFPESFYLRTELAGHSTTPNVSIFAAVQNVVIWRVIMLAVLAFELVSIRVRGRL